MQGAGEMAQQLRKDQSSIPKTHMVAQGHNSSYRGSRALLRHQTHMVYIHSGKHIHSQIRVQHNLQARDRH